MTLEDLFKRLSYGPFSNIALGNDGDGTILEAKKPAVVSHINDALIRLYSRFVLNEKEVVIQQSELITVYTISNTNAVSYLPTDPESPAYVIDTEAEPFLNDIIKIAAVYDDEGEKLPLNRDGDPDSVFTPQINQLQVPVPIDGLPLYVIYQAKPTPLVLDPIDDSVEIAVPTVLETALIFYVAYAVYSNMNGQEHVARGQDFLSKYDAICQEVIDNDLVSSSLSLLNTKLDDRGFI